MRQLQNEAARGAVEPGPQRCYLRPFSGHKEASTQIRVQQAGQIREKRATGKRSVSGDRGKGGEGAGRSISAARTHSRFSK